MSQQNDRKELLCQVLGNLSSQLRYAMGNLCAAKQLSRGDAETNRRNAAIEQQSIYRMMRILNNLSDAPLLAEMPLFALKNADLPVWLDGIFRQAQPLAEQCGLTLRLRCAEAHHLCAVQEYYLSRLMWNLLSNAMKFTPAGGEVTLGMDLRGDQVLLSVTDTGCGIAAEQMDRIYEGFLHPEYKAAPPHGLGLGLPLCRAIAEGHGGRLLLTSREGEGTVATVSLPDKISSTMTFSAPAFSYTGGFQPVMVELSDALPYEAFTERNLDE